MKTKCWLMLGLMFCVSSFGQEKPAKDKEGAGIREYKKMARIYEDLAEDSFELEEKPDDFNRIKQLDATMRRRAAYHQSLPKDLGGVNDAAYEVAYRIAVLSHLENDKKTTENPEAIAEMAKLVAELDTLIKERKIWGIPDMSIPLTIHCEKEAREGAEKFARILCEKEAFAQLCKELELKLEKVDKNTSAKTLVKKVKEFSAKWKKKHPNEEKEEK